MREKIYDVIENSDNKSSIIYNFFMIVLILISIIPLTFKVQIKLFIYIDYITAAIFTLDYLLRFITCDYKLKRGIKSFFLYPFTPMAIIDLISILPSITFLNSGFKLFKLARLFRSCRVFRLFKFVRYSKSINLIITVLKKQLHPLLTVIFIALAYIFISALVIFNIEPTTFDTFFDAIYWATVSLTTVGYGDIYPVSTAGRIVVMISSLFGIAIVALPAGIISAGIMEEINKHSKKS